MHDWTDYMLQSKRPHLLMGNSGSNHPFTNYPSLFDYSLNNTHAEPHRDERDIRNSNPNTSNVNIQSAPTTTNIGRDRNNSGEEEWKNIYTMLNCISAMVDKTKRAITILQQRSAETNASSTIQHTANENSIAEIRRQTEEKVTEFRRNAEEAVNQVKRQAVIEIQRAVSAAETRAVELMAQERLKMEKMYAGMPSILF